MTRILLLVLCQLDQRSADFIRGVHAKVMGIRQGPNGPNFHRLAPCVVADSALLLALMMLRSFSQVLI